MCVLFLRKIRCVNLWYYIAYSEGHNGGRACPVDREDGIVKTSLSNNFSLLGPKNEPKQVCLSVEAFPLAVTYLHLE